MSSGEHTLKQQKRGRSIAMTADELDQFLATEKVCRVATLGFDGRPHVAPLWFVWDGTSLWLSSLVKSQRWTDLERDARVAIVVDAGTAYQELRGVELSGTVTPVGDIPRSSEPNPELVTPEELFARKYTESPDFVPDNRHGWLRLTPDKQVSWDFRKLAALAK